MTSTKIKIVLGLPPKTLHPNARVGWQGRMRDRVQYRKSSAELAWGYRSELPQGPLTRAQVRLRFVHPRPLRGQQPHDPDNLIAWAKTAIDSLQDAGILTDDRHLTYLPPEQAWLPTDDITDPPRLEITLYPEDPNRCPWCDRTYEPPTA